MAGLVNEERWVKYPLGLRILHWVRAILIFGLIWSGWTMAGLPEDTPMETFNIFYHNHKQFGVARRSG